MIRPIANVLLLVVLFVADKLGVSFKPKAEANPVLEPEPGSFPLTVGYGTPAPVPQFRMAVSEVMRRFAGEAVAKAKAAYAAGNPKPMHYLFRLGDGNDGNYPRFVVRIPTGGDPYAALEALVANTYYEGPIRKHIVENIDADGEAEYGIDACVHEGPNGETAFGAAWITAELQIIESEEDLKHAVNRHGLRDLLEELDDAAREMYERERVL